MKEPQNDLLNTVKNSYSTPPSSPINSLTGNPQESPPTQQAMREMLDQAMSALVFEMMQLRRTLWIVLNQTGPQEVDEAQCHPLWRMKATRTDEGKMRLEAQKLPEPTVKQIALLAGKLEGTMTPLEDAMDASDLKDYPPAYVHMRLQNLVVHADTGYWIDAALHKLQQQPTSEKN